MADYCSVHYELVYTQESSSLLVPVNCFKWLFNNALNACSYFILKLRAGGLLCSCLDCVHGSGNIDFLSISHPLMPSSLARVVTVGHPDISALVTVNCKYTGKTSAGRQRAGEELQRTQCPQSVWRSSYYSMAARVCVRTCVLSGSILVTLYR